METTQETFGWISLAVIADCFAICLVFFISLFIGDIINTICAWIYYKLKLENTISSVDVYDKIHKLATDDHRYVYKLITSLSNTQEYLLKTYGSYESLCNQLSHHKQLVDDLINQQQTIRSRMDMLSGKLQTLRSQNPMQELIDIQHKCNAYTDAVSMFGCSIDSQLYDKLVNEQISLNQQLSEQKSRYQIIMQ